MIINRFIDHQWKEFVRSSNMKISILENIIYSIIYLFSSFLFVLIGFFIDKILHNVYPGFTDIQKINNLLVYYFIVLFILRLIFQKTPYQIITPYLHLPINKKLIIHYILFKSVFNFYNVLPILIFVPFAVKVISGTYSLVAAFSWFFSIYFICLINNYLVLLLKRIFFNNFKILLSIIFCTILITIIDNYYHIFSIQETSQIFFNPILYPYLLVYPILVFISIYFMNFKYLKNNLFIDVSSPRKIVHIKNNILKNIFKSPVRQTLFINELKIISRNSKPKVDIFYGFMTFLISLLYISSPALDLFNSSIKIIITSIFELSITGLPFIYAYQMINQESSFFDFMMANNIGLRDYFSVKYILSFGFVIISSLLTFIFFYYVDKTKLIYIIPFLLYNSGISIFIKLISAIYSPQKTQLKGKIKLVYYRPATNKIAIIAILPIVVISLIFSFWGKIKVCLFIITLIGLIGILCMKAWMRFLIQRFNKRKYKIAENLRGQYS